VLKANSTIAASSISYQGGYNLTIGKQLDGTYYKPYFNGSIDEVAIYNKALTQEEIQANMSTKLTGAEDGLVAYYSFDDGTATDNSTGDNNGTIYGASPQAEQLMYDDLSSFTTSFTPMDDAGDWGVVNDGTGNYVYAQSKIATGEHIAIMNNETIEDGTIQTNFTLQYDSDARIRAYFRMDENGNGYAAEVKRYNNDAYLYLYTVNNYSLGSQIGTSWYGSAFFSSSSKHAIKIKLEGESIKIYLDNTLRISQKHSTYTSGDIAIGTYGLGAPAYFDDIVVADTLVNSSFTEVVEVPFTPMDDGGNWEIVDDGTGNYVYEQSVVSDSISHIAVINGESMKDGIIETKFKLQYDYNDRIRIYFRMDKDGNGYATQVRKSDND